MAEFFDVVHQAKEQPLAVHFRPTAQREAIEPLVVAHIREHRLDRGNALPVLLAPFWRIEALLHAHRMRLGLRILSPTKEGDVSNDGGRWCRQTVVAQRTRRAIARRAADVITHIPVRDVARPFAIP